MIRVNIVTDERVIRSITDISPDGLRLAWAQENEKALGYCAFTAAGEILLVSENTQYFELLIRAALNHLDLNGVKNAVCRDADLNKKLCALGFCEKGEIAEVSIADFFKPCCRKNN